MGLLLYPLLALALATQSFAAFDCNNNITISNADDAKQVRENCKIVGGKLILSDAIKENINLDGVEDIQGDWMNEYIAGDSQSAALFNLSSSTLKSIDGNFDFRDLLVENIKLPKLQNITGRFDVDLKNLTHADLTSLQHVAYLELKAPLLEEFKIDELKGFNGRGWISITDGGNVENLDGLFRGPIDATGSDTPPTIFIQKIPKVKQLTLGWKRSGSVEISGQNSYMHWEPFPNITLVLGGPDSDTMHLDSVELREGIVGVQRGSEIKNLTIGEFRSMNDLITSLSLPFHQVSTVRIRGDKMTSLEVPQEAEQWKNLNMSIWLVRSLKLDSTVDSSGKQTWYWPKGNMSSFYLMGDTTTNFFQSMMDGTTRVTDSLDIIDFSGNVDCDKIKKKINSTLPPEYKCSTSHQNGVPMSVAPNWLTILTLVCTIIALALL